MHTDTSTINTKKKKKMFKNVQLGKVLSFLLAQTMMSQLSCLQKFNENSHKQKFWQCKSLWNFKRVTFGNKFASNSTTYNTFQASRLYKELSDRYRALPKSNSQQVHGKYRNTNTLQSVSQHRNNIIILPIPASDFCGEAIFFSFGSIHVRST